MLFVTSSGQFRLERLPKTNKGDLRAWDAADELLLNTFSEQSLSSSKEPVLIINDTFGALATGLNQQTVHSWSDSYITHLATEHNYQLNQLELSHYQAISSTQDLSYQYKLVLLKIPKTLALLEDQLCKFKTNISSDTTIIAGAMSKHIHTSTLKLFEKIIGTTTTSRATKKARLIFSKNTVTNHHQSPYPKTITDEALNLSLINHANVFAKDHLDIGTRFMLEYLHKCPLAKDIIDLGCGNGALGIVAQRHQPQATLHFIDESYMAIASAKDSVEKNSKNGNSLFYISNCLSQFSDNKKKHANLILCNPPFHQAHSVGDHIAWQMFKQSYETLNDQGELWIIGNRHLGYHVKLKKIFGNCRSVASNKKFVILASRKITKE